jgi:hypothetical protein
MAITLHNPGPGRASRLDKAPLKAPFNKAIAFKAAKEPMTDTMAMDSGPSTEAALENNPSIHGSPRLYNE